jgi:hypothetical protein
MMENPAPDTPAGDHTTTRIVVVFSGATDLRWLRALKPGFRHCYAVLESVGGWLLIDPASHQTRIEYLGPMPLRRLLEGLQSAETTLVCCRMRAAPMRLAPVRPFTCVEAVKRLIGIHAPWTLTPWQLFGHLTDENKI